MSDNELIKDRSGELLAEEITRKLNSATIICFGLAFISIIVSAVSLVTKSDSPHMQVAFIYGLLTILFHRLFSIFQFAKASKVLKVDCDPEKFLEICDMLSDSRIGRGFLKERRCDYVYALMITGRLDEAEECINKYMTTKRFRMLRLNYLVSIYTKRNDEKYLEYCEEAKILADKLGLKGETITTDEILYKSLLVSKGYHEHDYENTKELILQLLDLNPQSMPLSSRCDLNVILGNIEYELGNKLDAAICYNYAYETGPKLMSVQKILPRLEELKASYGGKKD